MEDTLILEAYPDKIQAKLELKEREKRKNLPSYINGHVKELVFEDLKLWRVGIITVSFKGGNTTLHRRIQEVADTWSVFGNLRFDFGYDDKTGRYREWNSEDESHIRIGFEYMGYWSLVGTDSTDPAIVKPGDITLNLNNFDNQLPEGWEGTVLHEFGHAIGFHHEHQTPDIQCDFDWDTLYRYLAGPPNYWPKWKVDHNLRQLQSGGYTFSAHDSNSIMHYSFPDWMFLSKKDSKCFTNKNNSLSIEDQNMMQQAYPFEEQLISQIDSSRMLNLETLIGFSDLPDNVVSQHTRHLEYYKGVQ